MATAPNNRLPRIMSVTAKSWITPHMIRVTCHAPWMKELPAGIEGAHFKIFMPKPAQPDAEFARQLQEGPRPDVRTYTIRYVRPEQGEIDIDFVDHGDAGPASAWARRCVAGDIAAFAGPGPVKLADYYGDTYVIAADMSALPVAAATLEAMPRDAVGVAYLAVTSRDDQQAINAPAGVDVQWIVHPDPHEPAQQAVAKIKELPELTGVVQTCIAGESTMIKELRAEIINRRRVPKNDAYISGYWKIGLIEDEHQQVKRAEGD